MKAFAAKQRHASATIAPTRTRNPRLVVEVRQRDNGECLRRLSVTPSKAEALKRAWLIEYAHLRDHLWIEVFDDQGQVW